mgnify:CR=1 FL=1
MPCSRACPTSRFSVDRTSLQAIERASLRAADLNTQLRSMAEQLAPAAGEGKGAGGSGRADGTPAPALHLPGLQDIRGQWSGSVQAYGGGSSAASCDFDLRGQSWQWGSYGLDGLLAAGSYHEEEGVQLQEVGVVAFWQLRLVLTHSLRVGWVHALLAAGWADAGEQRVQGRR